MKISAGLAVYRFKGDAVEVLLAHSGGPFWAKKDMGGWSFPKGEVEGDADLLETAKREFKEELGHIAPHGDMVPLGSAKTSGKEIYIWAVEGDVDVKTVKSNVFKMEWPPKSGQQQEFPEVDKARWFALDDAAPRLHQNQAEFIPRLLDQLQQTYPGREFKTVAPDKPEQTTLL